MNEKLKIKDLENEKIVIQSNKNRWMVRAKFAEIEVAALRATIGDSLEVMDSMIRAIRGSADCELVVSMMKGYAERANKRVADALPPIGQNKKMCEKTHIDAEDVSLAHRNAYEEGFRRGLKQKNDMRKKDRQRSVSLDLAMMIRRICWQINKLEGDSSLKVLSGNAIELLKMHGLQGNLLREKLTINNLSA